VQAQEYAWAKWSIGLRLLGVTDTAPTSTASRQARGPLSTSSATDAASALSASVTQSITGGALIRTWAFRGTLHFVAAADVGWLTALLAPTIIAGNERRYRQLGLDAADFIKSNRMIEKVLGEERPLPRSQIAAALEAAGLSAAGQRLPYLLQRAALDGLICLGQPEGRESTYTLLTGQVLSGRTLTGEEALAELTQRYFASHGPATAADFIWWSGLPATDARRGIAAVQSSLSQIQEDGPGFWTVETALPAISSPTACCLPPFDEYLLGYKDRSAVLHSDHVKKVNAGGGVPKPTIILDGKVIGVWQRTTKKRVLQVSSDLFGPLSEAEGTAVMQAIERFAQFYEMPVEM
jgi:hypothetical protein